MRLTWDDIGVRLFKAGLDHGVLYPYSNGSYATGVAWNGLTAVDDNSTGHEKTPLYTNDRKMNVLFSPSEIGGTIKCYTYPDEFDSCIGNEELLSGFYSKGSWQIPFGLVYRTGIGNDVFGTNYAYEIHIIYNSFVTEAKESAATIGSDLKVNELSFSFESMAEDFSYGDPVSHLVLSSRIIDSEKLSKIEDILYGSETSSPRLPLPDELYEFLYASDNPDEHDPYPSDSVYPSDARYPMEPNGVAQS